MRRQRTHTEDASSEVIACSEQHSLRVARKRVPPSACMTYARAPWREDAPRSRSRAAILWPAGSDAVQNLHRSLGTHSRALAARNPRRMYTRSCKCGPRSKTGASPYRSTRSLVEASTPCTRSKVGPDPVTL